MIDYLWDFVKWWFVGPRWMALTGVGVVVVGTMWGDR